MDDVEADLPAAFLTTTFDDSPEAAPTTPTTTTLEDSEPTPTPTPAPVPAEGDISSLLSLVSTATASLGLGAGLGGGVGAGNGLEMRGGNPVVSVKELSELICLAEEKSMWERTSGG